MELERYLIDYYTRRLEEGGCCGSQGLGCGNLLQHVDLVPGLMVLDLGSGPGYETLAAAKAVGPTGRAIGVDLTPTMVAHARAQATAQGIHWAEFHVGKMEALPLPDLSVDRVISNCAVNLSQDKARVFAEAFRVLRQGGHLVLADVLRHGSRPQGFSKEGWAACRDGAEVWDVYQSLLERAGFIEISVYPLEPPGALGGLYPAVVRAVKP